MSISRPKHWYATGAAAVSDTSVTDSRTELRIEEVRFHLSAGAAAETLTIAIDSGEDAKYDVVLDTKAMSGLTDYVWRPSPCACLNVGDKLKVTLTNSTTLTWGLEVITRNEL